MHVTKGFELASSYHYPIANGLLLPCLQLYMAAAPFSGHCGYGHWLLDAAMDQVDFWRDVGAIGYYHLRGWL